jgi:hypothetical protein
MYGDRCQVKQDTRDLVQVLPEVLSCHETVKNDTGIRKSNRLQLHWLDGAGIRRTCYADMRPQDVIIGAISLAIHEVLSKI